MSKKIFLLLTVIGLISVFFTLVQRTPVPPCFNSDEAAFSYNAYSILKTARDEYGSLLPLRLKSFGDYKMPLYAYFSVPFIALFGLNEFGARVLNIALSFVLPFVIYLFANELFKNKKIGLVTAFLTSVSLGLHIMTRQAHEAYLAIVLTTLAAYFFIKLLQKKSWFNGIAFTLSSVLLLFSYHPGRLFVLFFLFYSLIHTLCCEKQKKWHVVLLIVSIFAIFSVTDFVYAPKRLENLAFFNNAGFALKINELRIEGGIKYLYNPLFIGLKDTLLQHLTYFSPQFLLMNGDDNYRFGYPGMSIFTPIEYLFVFVGIYFLFKNKERWQWFILSLTCISPLSASLSWAGGSLTRSLFLLIPLFVIASYGFINLAQVFKQKQKKYYYLLSLLLFSFFIVFVWDFYLFHFPKRLTTIHAWQCGYKEVNMFIKENYQKYDKFYITRDVGEPYIFTLFYLQYPPGKYQSQARLTAPDEYGFGQVEKFDKFIFSFKSPQFVEKGSVVIGSIDNFKDTKDIDRSRLQTVTVNGEPMFQIYVPVK